MTALTESTKFMGSLGYPPAYLSVHRRARGPKHQSFESAWRRLAKEGLDGVRAVYAYDLAPGGDLPVSHWRAFLDCSRDDAYYQLGAALEYKPGADAEILEFTESMVDVLSPKYGIGFFRPRKLGPAIYGIGLSAGLDLIGPEREEVARITRWGDGMASRVYDQGYLRDVYPYNWLTEPQLARTVNNLSLGDWISHASNRGSLSKVGERHMLWTVPEADIEEVRSLLWDSGLVFLSSEPRSGLGV